MADVKPRIKLDKKEAKKGDLIEVKALVSHVMETGLRKDASGAAIPTEDHQQVRLYGVRQASVFCRFRARGFRKSLHPVQIPRGGVRPVVLTWIDDDGSTTLGEDSITVT